MAPWGSAALRHSRKALQVTGGLVGFSVLEARFPFPHNAGKALGAAEGLWAGLEVEISLL